MLKELATDRAQILDHIKTIFQAFLSGDRQALRQTHAADWIGFQGPSTGIERGIEAYMKNAEKSLSSWKGTGFELLDSEVQLYGDVGIVYYVARYDAKDAAGKAVSVPLRSVDVYRRQRGHWIQAGSHISVIPSAGNWGEGK